MSNAKKRTGWALFVMTLIAATAVRAEADVSINFSANGGGYSIIAGQGGSPQYSGTATGHISIDLANPGAGGSYGASGDFSVKAPSGNIPNFAIGGDEYSEANGGHGQLTIVAGSSQDGGDSVTFFVTDNQQQGLLTLKLVDPTGQAIQGNTIDYSLFSSSLSTVQYEEQNVLTFNGTVSSVNGITLAPEPSTLVSGGIGGLLGLAYARRRRGAKTLA